MKPVESTCIQHISPAETMDIVRELRAHGLVQGTNFDFAFHQSSWNIDEGVTPSRAEFYFYQAKWRTFFALKYAS